MRKLDRAALTEPVVGLILFAVTAFAGVVPGMLAANVATSRWLLEVVPTAVADPLTAVLTLGATSITLFGLFLVGLWLLHERRLVAALSLSVVVIGVLAEVTLKSSLPHPPVWADFHRPTPYYVVPHLPTPSVDLPYPFPSGHSLRTTFLALVVARVAGLRLGRRGQQAAAAIAWTVVAIVAVMVVRVGWHWTTDAIGGIGLGVALAAVPAALLPRGPAPAAATPGLARAAGGGDLQAIRGAHDHRLG